MSIDSDIRDLIRDKISDQLKPLKRSVFELAKQISLLAKDPDTIECPYCSNVVGHSVFHKLKTSFNKDYEFEVEIIHRESGSSPDVAIARTMIEAIKLLADACALNQDVPF
jgi:benzoyl-CoA reductase/2-hydroxyglutaryl-CoA dehydratase subunit BcrC/BadD/HgdB